MTTHRNLTSFIAIFTGCLSLMPDAYCEIKTFPVLFPDKIKQPPSQHTPAKDNNTIGMNVNAPVAQGKHDLNTIMLLALHWHPRIKRAKYEVERLKSVVDEVNAAYYPNVEMGLNSGVEKDDYAAKNNKTNSLNISLEQMLYDFGSTSNRVDISELNVTHSAYEMEKEINNILYETISAYLQTVRYHQLISVMQDRIAGFTKIKEMTQKRVVLGASAESDYSQASMRVAESLSNYNDYVAQHKKWSATLDKMTNKKVASVITMSFPPQLEAQYNKSLRDITLSNIDSPTIKAAQLKLDIAKKQIDIEKDGHYPKVTLKPYYEHDLTAESPGTNNINKNRDRYGFFVNVKIPLYQGGSISSRVQQATEAFHSAQYNLDTEKNNAEQKTLEFSSQIQNIKISLEKMQEKEQSAIRTRVLYMAQYLELGSRSFSDLIASESEVHQTKIDIINSRYAVSSLSLESLYYAGELVNLLQPKG